MKESTYLFIDLNNSFVGVHSTVAIIHIIHIEVIIQFIRF